MATMLGCRVSLLFCVASAVCSLFLGTGRAFAETEPQPAQPESAQPQVVQPQTVQPPPAASPPAANSAEAVPEKRFLVRPFMGMTSLDVTFTGKSGTEVRFTPNSQPFIGLKLGYRGYAISSSTTVSVGDEATYGKSNVFDVQVGKAFRVWARELFAELFFQGYQGYYIENTSAVAPTVTGYIIRPDMFGFTFGLSGIYYLNRAFSHDDTFGEMRPRAASGGSWLVRASLGVQGISSDDETPFFPAAVRASFGEAATMYSFDSGFVSISAGYAYDWRIWRQLFLAGAASGGLSAATTTYRLVGTENIQEGSVGWTGSIFAALGYGGETFHGGASMSMNLEGMRAKAVDVDFFRFQFIFLAGARF